MNAAKITAAAASELKEPSEQHRTIVEAVEIQPRRSITDSTFDGFDRATAAANVAEAKNKNDSSRRSKKDPFADRKPITEVLHDIYDKNIQ